jgi:hypothetical protein
LKELDDVSPNNANNIEDDLMFGGFWYVNFKNLASKNIDVLDGLEIRRRTKSF